TLTQQDGGAVTADLDDRYSLLGHNHDTVYEKQSRLSFKNVSVTTAAGTAAKIGTTTDGDYSPTAGDIIRVTFSNGNTANSPTLNIDGSGAKNIRLGNTAANNVSLPSTATQIFLWYDGTSYQLFGSQRNTDSNTVTRLKG